MRVRNGGGWGEGKVPIEGLDTVPLDVTVSAVHVSCLPCAVLKDFGGLDFGKHGLHSKA